MQKLSEKSFLLRAMAYERKAAVNRIGYLAPALSRHLGCVLLYPDAVDTNHWLSEIVSFVKDVRAFTNVKKGRVGSDLLFKLMYAEPAGTSRQKSEITDSAIDHMNNAVPTRTLVGLDEVYRDLVKLVLTPGARINKDSIREFIKRPLG